MIRSYATSDVGKVRELNEDYFSVSYPEDAIQLFVLEDFCRELVAVPPEIHNVRPKAPSPLNDEEMTIEEKVNAYRIALETEAHRGKGAKSEAC